MTKHAIRQLPAKSLVKKFIYDGSKLFDKPDTAKLKREKVLNDAGEFLQENPFGLALVASYTDMKGDAEKDRLLTAARAMVVRDHVVQNFKVG